MLLTAPVEFIRLSALNVKVVRAGQISRIVGTSTRSDSRRQDLRYDAGGVSYWLMLLILGFGLSYFLNL